MAHSGCACCGDADVREACDLCAGPVCAGCACMLGGDVLLCVRCADVLGPCVLCDGPTQPPMRVDAEGFVRPDGSLPPARRYCPACEDLYCAACAPGGICPCCAPAQALVPRPDPGPEEGGTSEAGEGEQVA